MLSWQLALVGWRAGMKLGRNDLPLRAGLYGLVNVVLGRRREQLRAWRRLAGMCGNT